MASLAAESAAAMSADEAIAVFKRCNVPEKVIKSTMKKDTTRNALLLTLAQAGVLQNGCDKAMANLFLMVATKLKATTHEAYREQLASAVASGRLNNNTRVTKGLQFIHALTPGADLDNDALDKHCGVGLDMTDAEIVALAERVVQDMRSELLEKRYAITIAHLLKAFKDADERAPWANGGVITRELKRLQLETLGPITDADRQAAKAKSKASGKKQKQKGNGKGKGKEEKKGGGKSAAAGEDDAEEAAAKAEAVSAFKAARMTPAAFNSDEAKAEHSRITQGRIRTRFPPEPNGYLHIGHAKSCVLNFEAAFGMIGCPVGETNLRFDDTNPDAEDPEYIESIIENVNWLGWKPTRVTYSSDNFDQLYEFAERLINEGKAYVCFQSAEEVRRSRDVRRECATQEARDKRRAEIESPQRNTSPEENLRLFRDMRDRKYKEGECMLRLKISWDHDNSVMWDPVAYRIRYKAHPHAGDKWCIYPTYDYTHCIIDSLEHIDYSLCTLEFEVRRDSYYWLVNALSPPLYKSLQFEFSRLNIEYTMLSKRKLRALVERNIVDGWDDPRLFTINGLRRRGYTPEGINNFVRDVGFSRNENLVELERFKYWQRNHLDEVARRAMAIFDPVQIIIENWPEGKVETRNMPNHPRNKELGTRPVPFSRNVYINRSDWREKDEKGYFGFAPGKECKLKYAYNVAITGVLERDEQGRAMKLSATYDETNANKCKVLTWLADGEGGKKPDSVTVRLYENLFKSPTCSPSDAAPGDSEAWLRDVDHESKRTVEAFVDDSVMQNSAPLTRFQFERIGYFVVDISNSESSEGKLLMNRTLPLKSAFAKKKNKNKKN